MKRKIMIYTIGILCLLGLGVYASRGEKIAILGYHSFSIEKEQDPFIVPIQEFERQLRYLKEHHYKTLTLEQFEMYKKEKKKFPRKSILITIDDGYQSNYDLAFPLLKKYGMHAVVFYIGSNEDGMRKQYMDKDTLLQIKKNYQNIEVASHSYNLHEEGAIEKGIAYLKEDFHTMKHVLSTRYFAYPYGLYNKDIITVLKEENYSLAFTFGPSREHRKASIHDDDYQIPRLNINSGMPLWKFGLRIKFPL